MLTRLDYTILILNNLDKESHPDAVGVSDLLRAVEEEFKTTHGYFITTYGRYYAAKDWLMGLPTALTLPFYNYDITKWAEGLLERELSEQEEDELHQTYWDVATKALIVLFDLIQIEE